MIENRHVNVNDFDRVAALAAKVVELAEKYRTPLVPAAYEVWFSFVEGTNQAVVRRVKEIIESGSAIGPYEIEQIRGECRGADAQEQMKTANATLDREMDDILHLIQGHLTSSEDFSGSLDKEARGLSDDASPAKIRQTIEFLLAENRKMRAETNKLTENLERSKDQIQNLRSSLEQSRKNELLDPLTNIPNRRQLEAFLAEHMENARAKNTPLSLVMADIDHFKRVNDHFGHLIGDEVLKYFAHLLAKHVRGSDLTARYGGEEFAMVLLNTTADTAAMIVERIRTEMEKAKLMVTESNKPLGTITASFGIAEYCVGDDWDSLVKRADTNLYAAKNSGRNRIIADQKAAA